MAYSFPATATPDHPTPSPPSVHLCRTHPGPIPHPPVTNTHSNRTTKDVLVCDSVLPVMVYAFLQTIFMCLGTVFVVVSVNPWLLLVLGPLLAAFVPFRRQFLNTSRSVPLSSVRPACPE